MEMEDRESAGSGSGSPVGGDGRRVVTGTVIVENNAAVIKPPGLVDASGGIIHATGEASGSRAGENFDLANVRKRRGRPRKYDSNGNLNPAYIKSSPALQYSGFSLPALPPFKRGRGRPSSSSSDSRILASLGLTDHRNSTGDRFINTTGGDFTPHVVIVNTGEDVAGKILTFAQRGHRGICVMSATGSVSNVTLRQPAASNGLLTYEGRFEILTLTGSYIASDNGGMRTVAGGLSISVSSPDGHVIGGSIAGLLTAANPVQLVIGSFVPNGLKPQNRSVHGEQQTEPTAQNGNAAGTVAAATAMPGGNIYPSPQLGQGEGESTKDGSNDCGEWSGSGRTRSDRRLSPDIDISVPVDEP